MITVINKTNKGLYNQLFEQVEEWLRTHNGEGQEIYNAQGQLRDDIQDPTPLLDQTQAIDPDTNEKMYDDHGDPIMVPDSITSLAELFTFMEFITKHAPVYTRLPLDEEPFLIDANKRTITVPSAFASNGVSVQGDEISEILFFKIDRFFDATDLSQCDIYVQWKSSEIDDEDGEPVEGVSKTWIHDIESEPGYLIFGWPLSSSITKAAGNVTFSVRFYRLDNADKLIYSFSTLDQTVKIQPALDYDIEDIANDSNKYKVDDMAANIKDRAINSPASGSEKPLAPYWEENKIALFKSNLFVKKNEDGDDSEENIRYYLMNLALDGNEFSNVPLTFNVDALSDDSGIVSYSWTKINTEGNSVNNETSPFYRAINYIVTDDTDEYRALHTNKTYYSLEGSSYKAIPSTTTLASIREEDKDVYELVSTVTIDGTGRYTPFAQNRVGKFFSERITAVPVYIPRPAVPVLSDLTAEAEPILRTAMVNDEPSYTPITLSCDFALMDEFGNDVKTTGGKATFVWKRCALNGSEFDVLDNATNSELMLSAADSDAEGYYQVIVTNNLNTESESEESSILRVTKPAVKPVLSIIGDGKVSVDVARQREQHLSVEVSGLEDNECRTVEDSVSYQWYEYVSAHGDSAADVEAALHGTYAENTGGVDGDRIIDESYDTTDEAVIASAKTPNFIPPANEDGFYFCVVTNHYNGTDTSVASPFYSVTL